MNLSIQKSTLTSRRAIGITAILSACVVILAFNACRPSPSERLVRDIDPDAGRLRVLYEPAVR